MKYKVTEKYEKDYYTGCPRKLVTLLTSAPLGIINVF